MHRSRKNQNLLGRWLGSKGKGKGEDGEHDEGASTTGGGGGASVTSSTASNSLDTHHAERGAGAGAGGGGGSVNGGSVGGNSKRGLFNGASQNRLLQQFQTSTGEMSESSNMSDDLSRGEEGSFMSHNSSSMLPRIRRKAVKSSEQPASLLDDSFSEDWEHPLNQVVPPLPASPPASPLRSPRKLQAQARASGSVVPSNSSAGTKSNDSTVATSRTGGGEAKKFMSPVSLVESEDDSSSSSSSICEDEDEKLKKSKKDKKVKKEKKIKKVKEAKTKEKVATTKPGAVAVAHAAAAKAERHLRESTASATRVNSKSAAKNEIKLNKAIPSSDFPSTTPPPLAPIFPSSAPSRRPSSEADIPAGESKSAMPVAPSRRPVSVRREVQRSEPMTTAKTREKVMPRKEKMEAEKEGTVPERLSAKKTAGKSPVRKPVVTVSTASQRVEARKGPEEKSHGSGVSRAQPARQLPVHDFGPQTGYEEEDTEDDSHNDLQNPRSGQSLSISPIGRVPHSLRGVVVGVPFTSPGGTKRICTTPDQFGFSSSSLAISDLMDEPDDLAAAGQTSRKSLGSINGKSGTSLSLGQYGVNNINSDGAEGEEEEILRRHAEQSFHNSGIIGARSTVISAPQVDLQHYYQERGYASTSRFEEYLEDPGSSQRYAPPSRFNASTSYLNPSYQQHLQQPLPASFASPAAVVSVGEEEEDDDEELRAHLQEQAFIRSDLDAAAARLQAGALAGSTCSSATHSVSNSVLRSSVSSDASSRASHSGVPHTVTGASSALQSSANSFKVDELVYPENEGSLYPIHIQGHHQPQHQPHELDSSAPGSIMHAHGANLAQLIEREQDMVRRAMERSFSQDGNISSHAGSLSENTSGGRNAGYNPLVVSVLPNNDRNSTTSTHSDYQAPERLREVPSSNGLFGEPQPPTTLRMVQSEPYPAHITPLHASTSTSASGHWNPMDDVSGGGRTAQSIILTEDEEFLAMQQEAEMIELALQRSMQDSSSMAGSDYCGHSASGASARSTYDDVSLSSVYIDQCDRRDVQMQNPHAREAHISRSQSIGAPLVQNPMNSLLRQMEDHDNDDDDEEDEAILSQRAQMHEDHWVQPYARQQHAHSLRQPQRARQSSAPATFYDGQSRPVYAWERELMAQELQQPDTSSSQTREVMYEQQYSDYGPPSEALWRQQPTAHTSNTRYDENHWSYSSQHDNEQSFASSHVMPPQRSSAPWMRQNHEYGYLPHLRQGEITTQRHLSASSFQHESWMPTTQQSLQQTAPYSTHETEEERLARVEKEMLELAMQRSMADAGYQGQSSSPGEMFSR